MLIHEGFQFGGQQARIGLIKQLPKNIQILVGCSWSRLALSVSQKQHANNNCLTTAIKTSEGYVLGTHTVEQVNYTREISYISTVDWTLINSVKRCDTFLCISQLAWLIVCAGIAWEEIYKIYLHAKGPGYQFSPEWETDTVTALVKGIVQDRAFDRMSILSDALQDAGLDDPEVLFHLQNDQCYLSDWVIWNVMGWDK